MIMSRPLSVTAFILAVFAFSSHADPQSFPLGENLRPGAYAVGYRSAIARDRSRTFLPERTYDGRINTGDRSRPLLIQFFYPARVSPDARHMTYGDHLSFKGDTPASTIVVEGMRRRTQEIHDYYQRKYLQAYGTGLYEALLKLPTAAVRNAPVAKGRFPVVLYTGGTGFGTDENIVLWEYLASHGFVVAVVPMMATSGAGSSADAVGLETQTRDLEFLFGQMHDFSGADMSRVGAMGFSYGGQSALLMAMRNRDIRAVVGLDASFISKHYSQFLKNSPFYNVENVVVPVLEMHRADEKTVTYDVTSALRYSDRYSFEIDDLNHVDFDNYAVLYTALLPEAAQHDSPISTRKAAYEGMSRYILDFLNLHLKAEKSGSSGVKDPAEWKGYPRESVRFRHTEALPAPPSGADLLRVIREQGVSRGEQVYREVLERDPNARVLGERSISDIGDALLGSGNVDEAVRVLQLNVERFPSSANTYDSLADAYKRKGNQPCAAYAYRKLLEVVPQDTALDASLKSSLQTTASEYLQKLQTSGVTGTCEFGKE
jgi:dienelactone hydrolase